MLDVERVRHELTQDLDEFRSEVSTFYQEIVLPRWNSEPKRYPRMLYGCMMWSFSRIDLLSCYWMGDATDHPAGNQTKRMIDFMRYYMGKARLESSVAVQMFRHKLMHTSEPRKLFDSASGQVYGWLLHWSPEKLQGGQHFTVGPSGILQLTLLGLIDDLKGGLEKYLDELEKDERLQWKFEKAEAELNLYEFRNN